MPPLLRAVIAGRIRLRRSISTAAPRPPWAMMYRVSQGSNSTETVSSSLAPPPSVSFITMPSHASDIDPFPPEPKCVSLHRGLVLAASTRGFLLLDTHMSRLRAEGSDLKLLYRRFARFVCNPVTGQLLRLPDFHGAEETLTDGMGLLTQAKRYAVAQLTELDDGRRFLLRRFSSETGDWDEKLLPSPMPPRRRRMDMIHEVLDYGGRLWWVDVSWGAVCVDPFSDRPKLSAVELPESSMLPDQLDETDMRQLIKHRHMGVCAGRLRYAEVDPFHVSSFTLHDDSGRWMLDHQVPVAMLWPNGVNNADENEMALVAAVDPLHRDVLHLNVDKVNVSVDMSREKIIKSTVIPSEMSPPSQSATTSYLPCVLPSALESSPIPGKKYATKDKTLADVLVRSDRH